MMDILSISTLILAVAAIITVFVTLVIAIFNFLAVKEMEKEAKASVMQKCTESYIMIRRQRSKAIMENSVQIAKDYYREICDLHWSEFRLYSDGLIPKNVMKAWLDARARNFSNDQIELGDNRTGTQIVKYSEEWVALLDNGYFETEDPFVQFMNNVHEGRVDDVLD